MSAAAPSGLSPAEARRWTRVGVLAACAIVLSYLETFVPIPIPGVKLGLANIAVLIALAHGDVGGAFAVSVIKVLVTGLLFGNPVMMAYSVAGTLLAFCVMAPLSRLQSMHLAMTSVAGAIAHEAGQLAVARVILGTPLVWYSAPVLLVAGVITGLLCGMAAARTVSLMEEREAAGAPEGVRFEGGLSAIAAKRNTRSIDVRIALAALLVFAIVVLRARSAAALAVCLALAAAACAFGRVKPASIWRALAPVAAIFLITLVMQVISNQTGEVLVSLGGIAITREALASSCVMAARLVAITAASIAFTYVVDPEDLVSFTVAALGPLRRIGVPVEGLSLAFSCGIAFVPALMARLDEAVGRNGRAATLKQTPELIAEVITSAEALARDDAA